MVSCLVTGKNDLGEIMVASGTRQPTGFVEGDDGFGAQSIHSLSSSREHVFNCKSVEQTITLFGKEKRYVLERRYGLYFLIDTFIFALHLE